MKIENDYFYVSGIYYLKSFGDRSGTLVYPFPVNPLYGEVDSVYIFNLTNNEIIKPLEITVNSVFFKIDFGNNSELVLLASYRQKLLSNSAEYILESTISWRKPLEQANFQLIMPYKLEITNFSIPPQDSIIAEKDKVYFWKKYNYMPDKNMVFEFIPK